MRPAMRADAACAPTTCLSLVWFPPQGKVHNLPSRDARRDVWLRLERQHLRWRDLKRLGQYTDIYERNVALAPFDTANI